MKSAALHEGEITYCDAPSLRRLSLLRRTRTSREIKDDTICGKYYIVKQQHCQGLLFYGSSKKNVLLHPTIEDLVELSWWSMGHKGGDYAHL